MLAATHTDAVLILRHGEVVYERYYGEMTERTPHLYQSVSKSVGACVAARLIERGCFAAETPLTDLVPELVGSGYDGATVRHLLDMQVGVRFSEEYDDDDAEIARLDRLYGFRPRRADDEPGSSWAFATETVRQGEHGAKFHYVSLDLQVLGWVMERATGLRVPHLIAREVWDQLRGEHDACIALDASGAAQLEGGFCSSLRDLGRFGLLLCRGGEGPSGRVLPEAFVTDCEWNGDREAFRRAGLPDEEYVPEPAYRNNFWTARSDGRAVLMGVGIFGQFLYVDRAAGMVMAKFSTWPGFLDDLSHAHQFWAARSLAELLA
jgi:CubicO group peptidase (beta-lactamase class C family)